eukprot:6083457-Prymnesium_polylepis.1
MRCPTHRTPHGRDARRRDTRRTKTPFGRDAHPRYMYRPLPHCPVRCVAFLSSAHSLSCGMTHALSVSAVTARRPRASSSEYSRQGAVSP